eukprot:3691479-Rhodomonas_salina.1
MTCCMAACLPTISRAIGLRACYTTPGTDMRYRVLPAEDLVQVRNPPLWRYVHSHTRYCICVCSYTFQY